MVYQNVTGLTFADGGTLAFTPRAVTVEPDPISDPMYISASGNDGNDGKTIAKPKRTLSQHILRAGITVMLQRNGVFETRGNISLPADATLTWYGDATKAIPIVRCVDVLGSTDPVILSLNAANATVDGVRIEAATAKYPVGVSVTGDGCRVLNCQWNEKFEYAIRLRNCSGAIIRGNKIPIVKGYGLYGSADVGKVLKNLTIEANEMAGSIGQTTIRLHNYDTVIIRKNKLSRPNPGTYQGSILRLHDGSNVWVEDNDFFGGRLANYAPVGIGPLAGPDGGSKYQTTDPAKPFFTTVANKDRMMRMTTKNVTLKNNRFDDVCIHLFPGVTGFPPGEFGVVIDGNQFVHCRDHVIGYKDDPAYAPAFRPYPTLTATNNQVATLDPARKFFMVGSSSLTQSNNKLNGVVVT